MKLPKLPDDALTVVAAAGIAGLREYAGVGCVEQGIYECPACDGVGSSQLHGRTCWVCAGAGRLVVEPDAEPAAGWQRMRPAAPEEV